MKRKNLRELCAEKAESEMTVELKTEIDFLDLKYDDLRLSFAIAILELGVSMHYIYIWRKLRGEAGCIRDGNVGLMGVASSALILYEGYRNIVRAGV